MLTESRVAISLSFLALTVSVWQAVESRKANRQNEEDVRIEVKLASPQYPECGEILHGQNIDWEIVLLNNSNQPALISDLSLTPNMGSAPNDSLVGIVVQESEVPITIPPKSVFKLSRYWRISFGSDVKKYIDDAGICRNITSTGSLDPNWSDPILADETVANRVVQLKSMGLVVRADTPSGKSFSGYGFVDIPKTGRRIDF